VISLVTFIRVNRLLVGPTSCHQPQTNFIVPLTEIPSQNLIFYVAATSVQMTLTISNNHNSSHGSWVTRVMDQFIDGLDGSWVTKCDLLSAVLRRQSRTL